MYLDSLLRSQFGRPSGLLGSLVMGPLLNLSNSRLVNAAVDLLDPQAGETVLDVGFGGALSLMALADRAPQAALVGVDLSREMVERAAARLHDKGLDARVSVQRANVARLPFPAAAFHRVLTVNSLYYWTDFAAGLRQIARVTRAGGLLVAAFRSPESLGVLTRGWEGFRLYTPDQCAETMEGAGFEIVHVEHGDRGQVLDTVLVAGRKRSRRPHLVARSRPKR